MTTPTAALDANFEKYIAEINPHEMAMRIAEASMNVTRPAGFTAEQGMKMILEQDPDAAASFYRAALAAAKYLEEAINNYQRVN